MEDKRLIQTMRLRNLLSYGPKSQEIELLPLNVLIGPNSSGKSNLLEAIGLLQAAPTDLLVPVREGGGVLEWPWKGPAADRVAEIEAIVSGPTEAMPVRYKLSFTEAQQRFELVDETIEPASPSQGGNDTPPFFYRFQNGRPVISIRSQPGEKQPYQAQAIPPTRLKRKLSILSPLTNPNRCPELAHLSMEFGRIELYREWRLGRDAPPRRPQSADMPEDFLFEDASNLGLVLNDLQHQRDVWPSILDKLRRYDERIEDVTTRVRGGTVQLFLHERGLQQPISASRLSDGTLRYLCLVSILCHPEPPPLICIEEPEIGLHPDAVSVVADLLIEASLKTQLIVTTQSDSLVSALSDTPESVLVCEKGDEGTELRRLDRDSLDKWLEKYALGDLWRMGKLGGNPC